MHDLTNYESILDENTELREKNIKLEIENVKLREIIVGLQEECLVQSLKRRLGINED